MRAMHEQHVYDAVVIGAGVAGLYAARQLVSRNVSNICVVEAQESIGGRVQQVHGLTAWPLEAGAEFIHGSQSVLVDICKAIGMRLTEISWPDRIYWGDDRTLAYAGEGSKIAELEELDELMFVELPKQEIPAQDVSVKQWMQQRDASPRVLELADVCYSNDFACSLHELGLTEAIIESRTWSAGEEYLLKDRSLKHLVDHLAKGIPIRTGWPVAHIEWRDGGANVHARSGEVLACRTVICAVPISQLQNASIRFTPPLPPAKAAAIGRVRMGNAVKVFAVFSEPFWPADVWDVVCTHRDIPELWMTRCPAEDGGHVLPPRTCCVTGFCTGDRARAIGALSPADAVRRLALQLDEMFGTPADPAPAQRRLVRGYVRDWSKVPFVEGAYTHPSLGARAGDRGLLAAPVGACVFFAGEHSHLEMNPCLQGAMETGDRAAAQAVHALAAAWAPVVSRL